MSSKLARRIVAATLMAAFVALLAPMPVQAQATNTAFTIKGITAPQQAIKVDVDAVSVSVPWEYSYPTGAVQQVQNAVVTAVSLQWDPVKCDKPGVTIAGAFSETIVLENAKTVKTGTSVFTFGVSQEAPGETQITCTFSGKVLKNGALDEAKATGTPVIIRAAYRGIITASVPATIQQAGPQKPITYSIDVQNLGNSQTDVVFSMLGDDGAAAGWKPIIPIKTTLTSAAQGQPENSKQTVSFTISTPYKNGWNNKETTFQLQMQPVSNKDPENSKGTPLTVTVLARVRGIYVPGPEVGLAVLGVIGVAMVVSRLRRDE